jgi:sulfite dehydrogenase (cytochrome) subunit B
MRRLWICFAALAFASAGAAISANTKPPQGVTTVELPNNVGPTFKPGPGAEVASQYCLTCHAPAYVAIQPPLSSAQWTAEVTKMRKAYGASIPDSDAATIVQYLTNEYGKR